MILLLLPDEARLGSIHAKHLFTVVVDGHGFNLLARLDEIGGVDDWISIVLLPLLQILTILDSIIQDLYFPLMFLLGELLILVPLNFVGQEFLRLVVVGLLVVDP